MKLLLVEDEPKTAAYVSKGLQESGYTVDIAANGEDGLALAASGAYQLLILDIMLPKLDGWALLSRLRESGVNTLALYLTARGETENRVKGLNIGADAYLVKPFAFPELLAMIRSLLKRKNAVRDSVVRIGDLEIDPVAHRVLRAGQRLNLTLKEFRLLYLMASREGEVLSRAQIGEHVWNMKLDCENNIVDVHIGRLRLKVDDPFEKKLIHTIRGVGYVLRLEE